MRQILIIGGTAIIVLINFMLYCCLRVASEEDQMLEKLRDEKIYGDSSKL